MELITAWLFLAAAVTGVVLARRAGLHCRHPALVIPAIALLCFLEETNWGTKEIGIVAPRVHRIRLDGIHDLLPIGVIVFLEQGSWKSRAAVALGLRGHAGRPRPHPPPVPRPARSRCAGLDALATRRHGHGAGRGRGGPGHRPGARGSI